MPDAVPPAPTTGLSGTTTFEGRPVHGEKRQKIATPLMRIEPKIGYSLLLYDISKEQANRLRAELGYPLLP